MNGSVARPSTKVAVALARTHYWRLVARQYDGREHSLVELAQASIELDRAIKADLQQGA